MDGQISPMIAVGNAQAALEFYMAVFGASVIGEVHEWEGKIGHAELDFGYSKLMVADEFPEYNTTPERLGGTPVMIYLTVDDTDARYASALSNGAEGVMEPMNQPHGRAAKFKDPFGHVWYLNQQS